MNITWGGVVVYDWIYIISRYALYIYITLDITPLYISHIALQYVRCIILTSIFSEQTVFRNMSSHCILLLPLLLLLVLSLLLPLLKMIMMIITRAIVKYEHLRQKNNMCITCKSNNIKITLEMWVYNECNNINEQSRGFETSWNFTIILNLPTVRYVLTHSICPCIYFPMNSPKWNGKIQIDHLLDVKSFHKHSKI